MENVFDKINPNKKNEVSEEDAHIKRAIADLMRTPHGRTFIRAINTGISPMVLNHYIMNYEENK